MQVKRENFATEDSILSRAIGKEAIAISVKTSVKAGDVYPANDATALGVIEYDVDVVSGDTMPASLIKKGYININKMTTAPATEAKNVLPMIVFENL